MESSDVRIARMDENIKTVLADVKEMKTTLHAHASKLQTNFTDVALLKRDSWWRMTIIITIGGFLGTLGGVAVEYLRR